MKTFLFALGALGALLAAPISAQADSRGHGTANHSQSFRSGNVYRGGSRDDRGNDHRDYHGRSDDHRSYYRGGGRYYGRGYYRPYYGYGYPGYFGYYAGPSFYYSRSYATVYHGDPVYYSDAVSTDVQRELKRRGFYHGSIDGDIGPASRAAIRAYQVDRGFPVTSTIDSRLLDSLGLD